MISPRLTTLIDILRDEWLLSIHLFIRKIEAGRAFDDQELSVE